MVGREGVREWFWNGVVYVINKWHVREWVQRTAWLAQLVRASDC